MWLHGAALYHCSLTSCPPVIDTFCFHKIIVERQFCARTASRAAAAAVGTYRNPDVKSVAIASDT